MRLLDAVRQALAFYSEAVVHRGDLDFASGQVFDRVVRAMMALMHLFSRATERKAHQLVAEADAEHGLAGFHQRLNGGHSVFAGRRRVTRAVAEEDAIGIVRENILRARRGRNNRYPRTLPRKLALFFVVLADLIWLVFNLFMIRVSIEYLGVLWERTSTSPSLGIDMVWPESIVLIGFVLMTLRLVQIYVLWYANGCTELPGVSAEYQTD